MESQVNQQDTEERISALERSLAALKAEIEAYKQAFEQARTSPVARQVLGMLGVKLD
jgi:hypothetical protein